MNVEPVIVLFIYTNMQLFFNLIDTLYFITNSHEFFFLKFRGKHVVLHCITCIVMKIK